MTSFKKYKTRPIANAGKKMPLFNLDGTESENWLMVLGVDSDAARAERDKANRDLMMASEHEFEAVRERCKLDMVSSLIADWSFDEPYTRENAIELLKDNPSLADDVDRFAANRKVFFGEEPTSSVSGQRAGSRSKAQTKAE